jgi:hypothetical protein
MNNTLYIVDLFVFFLYFPNFLMTLLPFSGAATLSVPFRSFRSFRRAIAFQMPQASLSLLS